MSFGTRSNRGIDKGHRLPRDLTCNLSPGKVEDRHVFGASVFPLSGDAATLCDGLRLYGRSSSQSLSGALLGRLASTSRLNGPV